MLRNFLKVALRNIWRHKAQSAINVLGLSVGLACSFLIVLWVQDEMSYDQFHEEKDQIYRVMRHAQFGADLMTTASVPKPLDDVLVAEYPEITHSVLVGWETTRVLTLGDVVFRAAGRYFGSSVFEVFSFPLIVGDPATVLQNPESITISATLAEKFFGENWHSRDDLVGMTLRIDNDRDVTLTGIFEDVPSNSTIEFEYALPIQYFIQENDWVEHWGNNGLRMFVRLDEGANGAAVSMKIKDLIDQHVDRWETDLFLQPISDVYLRSDYDEGVLVGGRIEYVRIFLMVALFIILIASINFMNLATARGAQRAKEIGVRKSVGATKALLARQFLGESLLTAGISFIVAMALVVAVLPAFNALTDKSVGLALLEPDLWLLFAGISILTGLLAGSYPALYLSSFSVIGVLRSTLGKTGGAAGLRKGLVVFQFAMSIVLIVGTFTVYQQLSYIRSKDLGVDRDNVVYLDFEGSVQSRYDTFEQEMRAQPGIVDMATSTTNPLDVNNNTISATWEGKDPDDSTLYSIITTGYGLVETMNIEMAEGRSFSREYGNDSTSFVINETAAASMGMDDPVGQALTLWGTDGVIVGVVKDFHMNSFYSPIEPVIFRFDPEETDILYIRIAGGQTSEALAALERVYAKFNPEYPLDYRFLDEEYEDSYRSEVVIGSLANSFAMVALLIACLGLFGLASFTAEQRTKEIGVRKVLGASVPSVVALLSREFLILVGGAFIVAAPVSYYLMDNWLNDFEFHADFGIGILLVAGVGAMLIAWLTVSYQSIKVAMANPVVALRSE